MKYLLFSDLHRDKAAATALVLAAKQVDFVLGAGDFANRHEGLYDTLDILCEITKPAILVAGNGETFEELRDAAAEWKAGLARVKITPEQPVAMSGYGNRVKPFIDPAKFSTLLALIPEPYATMVYVAVYTGLRPSELIGLKWRNIHTDTITVDERYCRGEWGIPKSEASNATIPVNAGVIERVHWLKTVTVEIKAGTAIRRYAAVKGTNPDDLVFASVKTGVPMRDNNILSRFIKPAARMLGMGWVNWQVLRRSHATWLKLAGADVKDAQAQMRHSRVTTTLEIYQQFVPESQRKVVNKLSELTGTGLVNPTIPNPVPLLFQ